MAFPPIHRESPSYAPDCPPSIGVRIITIRVVGQSLRRVCGHLLHCFRHPLLFWDRGRRNVLIHATWKSTRRRISFASHLVVDTMRYPFSRGISFSHACRKVGNLVISLLRIKNAFRIVKYRLTQWINSFRHAGSLPVTLRDTDSHSLEPRNDPGLRVRVRNLEGLQRQNKDNALRLLGYPEYYRP